MKTIKQLAIEHKCDKAAPEHHTYDKPYEFHFGALRDQPVRLLELGVGGYSDPKEGGASLRMFKEYFTHPFTQIYGIDIIDKKAIEGQGITTFEGSATDVAFLDKVIDRIGEPDIIIDDSSHISSDIITSFKVLFPKLTPNGIYVIEDIQTSYWKGVYGGGGEDSAMNYFKGLTDGLNYKEQATEDRAWQRTPKNPDYFDLNILSIHFYHNIIFVYKGENNITA